MARIDYEDDDTDDLNDDAPPAWRRRAVTAVLALVGLGLGFLIPYTLYLNHQVSEKFGALTWQVPTRVYARPLQITPGVAMNAATLKTELDAAGYREGDGVKPGTYASEGGRWTISSRGYRDVDGAVAPGRVQLTLSGGRVSRLRDGEGERALKVARMDPARIATLYGQRQEERRLVRIDEVPQLLTDTLQAVEDKDFAHHHGIDLSGMARAAMINLRAGETRQGASTLTQQLARSGLLGIGREQTYTRKFNEILYAMLIEARYGKGPILEAYLNQVYLGQRGAQAIHGVAAGAEFWFGRRLDDLETEQVALLVGIIRGPSHYDPRRNPERALERRDFVLGKMLESGLIDQAAHDRAVKRPLGVTETPGSIAANRFPAYVDLVRRQLARDYPTGELQGAGLSVMTAMAPSAQAYAEGSTVRTIKDLSTGKRPPLQAGLVVTDVHSGEVVAAVGSRDPVEHGFNRVVEAHRPVGSLLKPFVYLLAFGNPAQYSLASWVDDSPVTITLENGQRWSPGNSDGRSHGTVRMIDALARSYNQATVRIGEAVGARALADLVHVLAGVRATPNPSLTLGSMDQSPYAMAQLYQFLASGGEIQPLRAVRGVIDEQGRVVNRYDNAPRPAQEGDAIAARLVTLGLQHAVTSGTGRQLVSDGLGRLNAAGKTGTSNDGRDSWFAGWTGDHLAVVWVGNDQNEQTGLYGATGAMRVWSGIFSRLPSAPLEVGDAGLEWQWVAQSNSTDADCPDARRFAFVAGYAPPYQPCPTYDPNQTFVDADGNLVDATGAPVQQERRGWREFFGFGRDEEAAPPADTAPPAPAPAPAPAPPVEESP
ncbi:penicillin-binding protein 1B [Luteimonas fraxinea]|uniref:Penicillin-binding protein 1B n=1 Tax=Luteimonas fraxinea TaxID=2901869 RepID=A0ABS8UB23_9GAMM|nr:penicillin-binding protein 1B [Luteimonas fraxinea]MCD9095853.1 penicillin-binding protein 1B [Luteimonas fraxinea]MCD9124442.1 penicillin-binding protein 1B [Luteimonas fraxinea]UHH10968.1 penicillin-binding protein 1B [Luteimonas fraxinea]